MPFTFFQSYCHLLVFLGQINCHIKRIVKLVHAFLVGISFERYTYKIQRSVLNFPIRVKSFVPRYALFTFHVHFMRCVINAGRVFLQVRYLCIYTKSRTDSTKPKEKIVTVTRVTSQTLAWTFPFFPGFLGTCGRHRPS
jgi:hypothetical protein